MAKRSRQEKKGGNKPALSEQDKDKTASIVNTVTKASFTKQQKKEVQQAIEQGIDQYKRQHKAKLRDYDKQRKKLLKEIDGQAVPLDEGDQQASWVKNLPWYLLIASWLAFIIYAIVLKS